VSPVGILQNFYVGIRRPHTDDVSRAPKFWTRLVGYGRRGGRDGGRGRGRGIDNRQQKNRYNHFSDGDFEDAEEDEIVDDEEDEADTGKTANEDKTKLKSILMAAAWNLHTYAWILTDSPSANEEYYDKEDFITEEEMQLKRNTAENEETKNKEEMVGVMSVIKKKRALSIIDEADTENKQDDNNTTDATQTAEMNKERHGNATTGTTQTATMNKESHGTQEKCDKAAGGSIHQDKRKKQPQ
jgi:hypothetical protein